MYNLALKYTYEQAVAAYIHGKKLKLKVNYRGDQLWQRGTKYSCRRQSGGTTFVALARTIYSMTGQGMRLD